MQNHDFGKDNQFAMNYGEQQPPMPTVGDLEVYRLVFELFDRDNSGYIDDHDLAAIAIKVGLQPEDGKLHLAVINN